ARPGGVDAGRPASVRGVMGRKRCVLVSPLAGSLEPARKCGVQPRASRSWQAVVSDLARQRVLDRVFAVTRKRGSKTTADEVTLFEYPKVWLRVLEELVHRPRPEDPADDRGGLERLLLLGVEQIDARRDDRLHRIRNGEACRQLPQTPGAILPLEQLPIDQCRKQLLDEER